ncbi:MAG: Rrf2 family transcriptional regulator [Gammaproteobacteria bacterium]|nr:Rrf2 family transcriptional regulator [Gammaproteobacteria bacterium]
MQITRQADYAMRAVIYLAEIEPDRRAATSLIAEAQHIPPSFLAKIVSQLSVAGLLQTSRGARGGVSLARSADEISLLEVIEAIDGPILLNECVADSGVCTFGEKCVLRPVFCDAQSALVSQLSNTSFGDITSTNGKTLPTAS